MPQDIIDLLNDLDAEELEAAQLEEEQYWDDLASGYYDWVDAPYDTWAEYRGDK